MAVKTTITLDSLDEANILRNTLGEVIGDLGEQMKKITAGPSEETPEGKEQWARKQTLGRHHYVIDKIMKQLS